IRFINKTEEEIRLERKLYQNSLYGKFTEIKKEEE
ncbi:hypothetical protein LCGC14_1873710, partial [marine sediment metagenome]